MKSNLLSILIILAILFTSCNDNGKETKAGNDTTGMSTATVDTNKSVARDEYLITDTSFGSITASSTYTDLEKLFKKNNLVDEMGYGAEGLDSFMVTKIFKDTPNELVVPWQKDQQHKKIASIDCYQENSPYHTADSLKVGSTLEKLMQVNGQPISFYGTSWDYGGTITSYYKGKLEQSKLYFQLEGKEDMDEKLMGDQELNTNMPLVKKNLTKLYVSKISLAF